MNIFSHLSLYILHVLVVWHTKHLFFVVVVLCLVVVVLCLVVVVLCLVAVVCLFFGTQKGYL